MNLENFLAEFRCMKIIKFTDYYTLYQAEQFLYMSWEGFQLKASVEQGCEIIYNSMVNNRVFKIINDNTQVKGLWNASWVAEDWFPKMVDGGLTHFAWIKSPEPLAAELAVKTVSISPACSKIHLVESKEEAIQWLNVRAVEFNDRKKNFSINLKPISIPF